MRVADRTFTPVAIDQADRDRCTGVVDGVILDGAAKLAAARGIAEVVTDDDLAEDYIIPSVFNRDVATSVANAVVEEAREAGLARFSQETGTYEIVDGDGSGDGAA